MTNDSQKPTRRRWPWAAALLFAVFVLYPLSLPPHDLIPFWIVYLTGELPSDELLHWLDTIYYPIAWAMYQSKTVPDLMYWYTGIVGPLLMPPL
jgi:hypothetical protein